MKPYLIIAAACAVFAGIVFAGIWLFDKDRTFRKHLKEYPLVSVSMGPNVFLDVENAKLHAKIAVKDGVDLYGLYEKETDQSVKNDLVYLMLLSQNEKYLNEQEKHDDHRWEEVEVWNQCLTNKQFASSAYGQRLERLLEISKAPNAQLLVASRLVAQGKYSEADSLLRPIMNRKDGWNIRAAAVLAQTQSGRQEGLRFLLNEAKGKDQSKIPAAWMLGRAMDRGDRDSQEVDKLFAEYIETKAPDILDKIVKKLSEMVELSSEEPVGGAGSRPTSGASQPDKPVAGQANFVTP